MNVKSIPCNLKLQLDPLNQFIKITVLAQLKAFGCALPVLSSVVEVVVGVVNIAN